MISPSLEREARQKNMTQNKQVTIIVFLTRYKIRKCGQVFTSIWPITSFSAQLFSSVSCKRVSLKVSPRRYNPRIKNQVLFNQTKTFHSPIITHPTQRDLLVETQMTMAHFSTNSLQRIEGDKMCCILLLTTAGLI